MTRSRHDATLAGWSPAGGYRGCGNAGASEHDSNYEGERIAPA